MNKKIISSVFVSILFISNLYGYSERKYDMWTGKEIPINSSTQNVTMTVTTEDKDLMKAKSGFDCDTGKISIDAEIIEDLNQMFKSFGSNAEESTKQFLKEMATQYGVDITIELLARLHYAYTQDTENGTFTALKTEAITKCFTNGLFNSFDSEIEIGLGMNIFDVLVGKVGINFVSLAGIYPCVKEVTGVPNTKEAKKQMEKSRQWVRFLFYKMLNSSFDNLFNMQLGVGKLDPKCEQLKKEVLNRPKVNLSQFGKILNPDGTYTDIKIEVMKPTPVGLKVEEAPESPEEDIKKEDTASTSGAKTPTEIKKEANKTTTDAKKQTIESSSLSSSEKADLKAKIDKASFLKDKAEDKYVYETSIIAKNIQHKPLDVIDLTDFSEEEIIIFNKLIYEKVKDIIYSEKTTYNSEIKEEFLYLLKKIFTLTKTNNYALDNREKVLSKLKYDTHTNTQLVLDTDYYGGILEKAKYYNNLFKGRLSASEIVKQESIIMQTAPNSSEDLVSLIKLKDIDKIQNKFEKVNFYKDIIAGGENLFTKDNVIDDEKIKASVMNLFYKDYAEYKGTTYTPYLNIDFKVNPNIIERKPLHELEYLRTLYQLESRAYIMLFLGATSSTDLNNIFISSNLGEIEQAHRELLDYIIKKIRIVKELYAVELLDAYSKKSEFIRNWVMEKYLKNNTISSDTSNYFEYQIYKFNLKLLEKRIMVKLLLEKGVK